jgi:post-segregation antitoxin (ccd killing protein)
MKHTTITLPDELAEKAKKLQINISATSASALRTEVEKAMKIKENK